MLNQFLPYTNQSDRFNGKALDIYPFQNIYGGSMVVCFWLFATGDFFTQLQKTSFSSESLAPNVSLFHFIRITLSINRLPLFLSQIPCICHVGWLYCGEYRL
jgi:hypothetical protein